MTVKALGIPIIYWISITSMAISTKIKANTLSLKSSSVYEHLSHKCSIHVKCWGQEPYFFFHEQRRCEGSNQANKISLPTNAVLSFMGITRNVHLILLCLSHFGEQGKVGLPEPLTCPNQGVVSKNDLWDFWTLPFYMIWKGSLFPLKQRLAKFKMVTVTQASTPPNVTVGRGLNSTCQASALSREGTFPDLEAWGCQLPLYNLVCPDFSGVLNERTIFKPSKLVLPPRQPFPFSLWSPFPWLEAQSWNVIKPYLQPSCPHFLAFGSPLDLYCHVPLTLNRLEVPCVSNSE